MNLDAMFRSDVPADFTHHRRVPRRDLCHHVSVGPDCDKVACEADGADDRSRDVDWLRSAEFTFNSEALADYTLSAREVVGLGHANDPRFDDKTLDRSVAVQGQITLVDDLSGCHRNAIFD